MIADLCLSHLVCFSKNSAPGWTSLWTCSAFKIELLIRDTNQFVGNLQSKPCSRENGPLCPSPSQDHSSWMKSSRAGFSPYLLKKTSQALCWWPQTVESLLPKCIHQDGPSLTKGARQIKVFVKCRINARKAKNNSFQVQHLVNHPLNNKRTTKFNVCP